MNYLTKISGLLAGSALFCSAQVYVLDNFNSGTATGSVNTNSSWNGQVTQGATTLSVGGTAKDDSGWNYVFADLTDLSAYNYVAITAQRDAGNVAANLSLSLMDDDSGNFSTITFNTSLFSVGSMTTVVLPVTWTWPGNAIASWNLGGGQPNPGTVAFRMTFDNVQLQTTSAVPEPSTYAAIVGIAAIAMVAYRRRQARAIAV